MCPLNSEVTLDPSQLAPNRVVQSFGRLSGESIATVAVARKLLTLVFYGLRDGRIRALEQVKAVA